MPFLFRRPNQIISERAQPALPRTDDEIRLALSQLPHYRVILHNDDIHEMDDVVAVLLRTVPQLTPEQARSIMLHAHFNGLAEVIICHRELAEFYRESLERFRLTSTIELV